MSFFCNIFSSKVFEAKILNRMFYLCRWWKLEEKLVSYIDSGLSTMVFKPTVEVLTNRTDNLNPAVVVSGGE